jgi:hypothetical protein
MNDYEILDAVWVAATADDTPAELAELLSWCARKIVTLNAEHILAQPSAGHPSYPYISPTWQGMKL